MLAELVCSNSLKSTDPHTASGLLKAELAMLGCRLLDIAALAAVPAGHALAVDREEFAASVTGEIEESRRVEVERKEQDKLPEEGCVIVASGR